ncbi:hypothetical protein [Vibrio jasicida]|nr:hypothetical protein [Vibrio jasicida]
MIIDKQKLSNISVEFGLPSTKNNNAALDAALKAGDGFDYLVATAA